jgi:hypothetical protein
LVAGVLGGCFGGLGRGCQVGGAWVGRGGESGARVFEGPARIWGGLRFVALLWGGARGGERGRDGAFGTRPARRAARAVAAGNDSRRNGALGRRK